MDCTAGTQSFASGMFTRFDLTLRLAFQNCHRAAVFRTGAQADYHEFITARSQILNQRPDLVDC
jgi:hypothetical protein